jgi:hypothetical protein
MTDETIAKLKDNYNQEHPLTKIKTNDTKKVYKLLKRKNSHCKTDMCWVNSIQNKRVQKEIKEKIFIPERPTEWKKKPTEWLSNFDILEVLNQYETAYPFFRFIGPSPIDFEKKTYDGCITPDLCSFHLNSSSLHFSQVGIVFNLDEHDEPGSHWVSMYIDIQHKHIYYFDSATAEIPKEIEAFKNRLIQERPDFTFLSNTVEHQRGNTECGMYSLFFIIQMLKSKNRLSLFHKRFNNERKKITDKTVQEYRKIYFRV